MHAHSKSPVVLLALTLIATLVAGAGWLAWKSIYHPEPVYQGQPLTAWAQQYGSNHWTGANKAADREAEFAIRQIGTNGIPFLLDQMQARDSTVKRKLRVIIPGKWQAKLNLKDQSGMIRRIGAHGLAALGTNAPAAVPILIEIATNHPDEDGRYIAVFTLRTLYGAAEPAIPFFLRCLTNSSANIRDEAAMGLGNVQRQPEIAVPALVNYVEFNRTSSTPNHAWEINDAIPALAKFGTNARPAVPVLLSLLHHPSTEVRQSVSNWLPVIDADAAAKAQVKRHI